MQIVPGLGLALSYSEMSLSILRMVAGVTPIWPRVWCLSVEGRRRSVASESIPQ